MKAMVFESVGKPLTLKSVAKPAPTNSQILVEIEACGVCRTDLHIIDGDLKEPKLPLIPGHQIVGRVVDVGDDVTTIKKNDRVGVPWLGKTCGSCPYCLSGKENLCDDPQFTGYTVNGGYAEFAVAEEQFSFLLPDEGDSVSIAPLLCAGLIGYRSYRMANEAQSIGFYGFGAAAHILIQLAVYEKRNVYVFTRPGDKKGQAFAKSLGAKWCGGSDEKPPVQLDAAIIFAPVGRLMVKALEDVKKGAPVISAGIHMTDIPSFPYKLLWEERSLKSVANLTRQDGDEFLAIAPKIPIKTDVTIYSLAEANRALDDLRSGALKASAVLKIKN